MITATVNGLEREFPADIDIRTLLSRLSFPDRLVVVEINGAVVYPENWDSIAIASGDRIEVVTFVGGG